MRPFASLILFFLSFVSLGTQGKCPMNKDIKPCQCITSDHDEKLVNVTCSYAKFWPQVKIVLDSFRNDYVIDNLIIESVYEHPTTNYSLIHKIFRHLTINNLIVTDCQLSSKIPRNIFFNATVRSLQFENLRFNKIPVRAFFHLPMLSELSLAFNALSSIGHKTFRFHSDNLKLLNLQGNNFTKVPIKALRRLTNLEILILSSNEIEMLSPNTFGKQKNLLALELADNKISSISADAFAGLHNLRHLGLSGNPLTAYGSAFSHLPSTLASLDIGATDIGLSEFIRIKVVLMETLVAQKNSKLTTRNLVQLTNLSELDIRGNVHLSSESFKNVTMAKVRHLELSETYLPVSVLKSFPNLNIFSISSNDNLTAANHGTLISKTFLMTPYLKIAHLEDCSIKKIDVHAFSPLENSLEELNLRNNRLTRLGRKTFILLKRLKCLDLSYNNFRDRYPHNVTDPIKPLNKPFFGAFGNQSVEKLALAGNNLRWIPEKMLRQLKSLKYLNLAANNIKHIQSELMNNINLEYLNINNNRIEFIQSDAFRNLHKLKYLNLGSNRLMDIGSIRFPNSLEELSLSGNHIEYFVSNQSSLTRLRFLKTLDLSFNYLSKMELDCLKGSKESLIYIDLSGNPLHCSCKLRPFIDWISENNITLSPKTVCWTPPWLHNQNPMKGICWKNCFENEDNSTLLTDYQREKNKIYCPPMEFSDDSDDDDD